MMKFTIISLALIISISQVFADTCYLNLKNYTYYKNSLVYEKAKISILEGINKNSYVTAIKPMPISGVKAKECVANVILSIKGNKLFAFIEIDKSIYSFNMEDKGYKTVWSVFYSAMKNHFYTIMSTADGKKTFKLKLIESEEL